MFGGIRLDSSLPLGMTVVLGLLNESVYLVADLFFISFVDVLGPILVQNIISAAHACPGPTGLSHDGT